MKKLFPITIMLIVLAGITIASTAITGCATTTPLSTKLTDCASNLAAGEVERLAPKVADLLRSGDELDWRAELSALVTDHGLEALRCVVSAFIEEANARLQARSAGAAVYDGWAKREAQAAQRARAWLDETAHP